MTFLLRWVFALGIVLLAADARAEYQCFTARLGRERLAPCFATAAECAESRQTFSDRNATVTACAPRANAFCMAYDAPGGSRLDCFATAPVCNQFRGDLRRRNMVTNEFRNLAECAAFSSVVLPGQPRDMNDYDRRGARATDAPAGVADGHACVGTWLRGRREIDEWREIEVTITPGLATCGTYVSEGGNVWEIKRCTVTDNVVEGLAESDNATAAPFTLSFACSPVHAILSERDQNDHGPRERIGGEVYRRAVAPAGPVATR